ncbi:hypothetical protein L3V79_09210 [Thiotrichales bacterium 19S9-12]|nr:hypothetical protein [Thiotrichales bacterium 19S9-11]MCF6812536.1 hypothetical protein [Thiotrichales bacterium 19S9-12]
MKSKMNNWLLKAYCIGMGYLPATILILFLFLLFSSHLFAEDGVDYLDGAADAVSATFGKDSNFIKIVYIGEVIVAIVTYITTKKIYALLGIVVLMLFVNFFLL